MAEAAAKEADDVEVRALAKRIAKAQRFEIGELRRVGEMTGLDATPDGGEFGSYDAIAGALREEAPMQH